MPINKDDPTYSYKLGLHEKQSKEKERKAKVESISEKMKLGGVNAQGNELGPSKREQMLRMGKGKD